METFINEHNTIPKFLVLTVPMRNGNNTRLANAISYHHVLTVPMRNGNAIPFATTHSRNRVLTVPMRNGNMENLRGIEKTYSRSYRTYEEWKPSLKVKVFHHLFTVLTVPMRNGNRLIFSFSHLSFNPFLPYL